LKHMFAPEAVPSLHKAEDTQRIYIVTKGQTECLDHSPCGLMDSLLHFLGRSSDQDTNDRQKYLRC
jgi:hypothetical protein